MKTPTIKQMATAAQTPVSAHVTAAHNAIEAPAAIVRLNIAIPKDLHLAVKMKAVANGTTMTEIVANFLREYAEK